MLKILMVSKNESDNPLLRKKLEPIEQQVGAVQYISARPANMSTLLESDLSLLIFNCPHFTTALRDHINHWRSSGYLGPIVILAKVHDPVTLNNLADMQNVAIVEKPYENKDLQGVAVKLINEAKVKQRRWRRYDTDQTAWLESYTSEFSVSTVIKNISKGGACISGDLSTMSKGDLLRIQFDLDEINKSHTMSAQVVWTSGEVGGERMAGLQFVSKETVYQSLLGAA
ncbi:MAG: PilZ domain-containing protein [Bdellovibrionales bacterium]|nr:PilZ domain-containing protein [Bdellovibrionales bacterium]